MPHYRCPPCQTRRRLPDVSQEDVGHLCPDCGSLLDPVSELTKLVGFRDVGRVSPTVPGHEAVTVRIEELLVRRALVREHNRQRALLAGAIDDQPPEPSAPAAVALPLLTR